MIRQCLDTSVKILLLGTLCFACMTGVAVASPVYGQWTLVPLENDGLQPADVRMFERLLQAELATGAPGSSFVAPATSTACTDSRCAAALARQLDVDVVVYGTIFRSLERIYVTISLYDAGGGAVRAVQKMKIESVRELEAVANRIARAILTETSTSETIELGNVTSADSEMPERREGSPGAMLSVGGVVPVGDAYPGPRGGLALDLGYWIETWDFAILPRVGARWDTGSDNNDEGWLEIPFDVGAFYIFGRKDFAPILGGGAGVRFVRVKRFGAAQAGSVIQTTTNQKALKDRVWGPSLHARGGFMFFRTYRLRMTTTLDYTVVFAQPHDQGPPHSFGFSLGMIFGNRD